jgi:hypothetical protein
METFARATEIAAVEGLAGLSGQGSLPGGEGRLRNSLRLQACTVQLTLLVDLYVGDLPHGCRRMPMKPRSVLSRHCSFRDSDAQSAQFAMDFEELPTADSRQPSRRKGADGRISTGVRASISSSRAGNSTTAAVYSPTGFRGRLHRQIHRDCRLTARARAGQGLQNLCCMRQAGSEAALIDSS